MGSDPINGSIQTFTRHYIDFNYKPFIYKSHQRLKLKDFNTSFYVETISETMSSKLKEKILKKISSKFVPLEVTEETSATSKTVYANISSISKRMGLSKKSIKLAAKENKLEELIKKSALINKEQSKQSEILFEKIARSNKKLQSGCTPKELTKAIKASLYGMKKAKEIMMFGAYHLYIIHPGIKGKPQIQIILDVNKINQRRLKNLSVEIYDISDCKYKKLSEFKNSTMIVEKILNFYFYRSIGYSEREIDDFNSIS